eukprot:TRINITY_DN2844_c0_g1::TRINITY_DN2844_c0_g1_i4::g.6179::m.6179 TRINITY_DN2844_c0_g1::TRINITY_DN2844_c0_g1_i4::g.6179  ORF type:complete len:1355 (+),score=423.35,sp/Q8T9W4/ABCB3_DICDI/43.86/0.0,sp/Q8T9W4/ABCB3_DICDI/40.03/2e-124,ABC_membrane/PF00664.18/1.2e-55,ABC_membrane/PF00664.18/1.4e-46,ABC_tran/PF00005.22/4.1e-35,ABC_tran/PF00005.22/1e-33,SMC_N/PF02463.14/5.3e-05,SMC_N/PF02463.14/40,SMC_N/PF02463.14/6.4e-05,AAA_21/PF13304.1/0.0079,AAA_21/PF13304.1/2.8,AAA_21/PF13304.1/0.0016,ABC_ATPase/PF09
MADDTKVHPSKNVDVGNSAVLKIEVASPKEKTISTNDADSKSTIAVKDQHQPVPFLQLFRFADKIDKICIIFGIIAAAVNGVMFPLFSIVFGELIDSLYVGSKDVVGDEVQKVAFYFLYIGIAALVLSYLEIALLSIAAERQAATARKEFLRAVLRQSIPWHDVTATTELNSKLVADSMGLQEAIGDKLALAVQFSFTFLGGLIVGFMYGWQLTLVMIASIPLLAFAGTVMSKVASSSSEDGDAAYASAGSVAEETISNMRTIAAFAAQEKMRTRYNGLLNIALESGKRKGIWTGIGMGLMYGAIFLTYALALWYGGKLISDHTDNSEGEPYTGGDVMLVFFGVLIGAMSIGQAGPPLQAIAAGRTTAARLYKIIDQVPPIDIASDAGKKLDKVEGRIELKGVCFAYPSRPDVQVFKGLNLTIETGKRVALVGASGSGKSTILSFVMRFYDSTSGSVTLDGHNVKDVNLSFLRKQFGLVGQEPVLFATTIAENIRFGKQDATMDEIMDAAKAANAHSFISKLPNGYDTYVGEKGAQMSGGQKQRIAIARAIIRNPRILLLDEATSALDAESERLVQDALERLMPGRTTIIVAHRLSTVKQADVIVALKEGVVVEQGSHAELMQKNGFYAQLVTKQLAKHPQEDKAGQDGTLVLEEDDSVVDSTSGEILAHEGQEGADSPAAGATNGDASAAADSAPRFSAKSMSVDRRPKSKSVDRSKAVHSNVTEANAAATADNVEGVVAVVDGKQPDSPANDVYTVPLSRVIQYNKEEWPYAVFGGLWCLVNAAVWPAYAYMLTEMLRVFFKCSPIVGDDNITYYDEWTELDTCNKHMRDEAEWWALAFLGLAIVSSAGNFFANWSFAVMGEQLTMRLRQALFENVTRQEIGWFDMPSQSTGALTSALASEVSLVQGAVGGQLSIVLMNFFCIVLSMILAFIYGWEMTLLMLAIFPLMAVAGSLHIKTIGGYQHAGKAEQEAAAQIAGEAIAGIRTVQAFGNEQDIVEVYGLRMTGPMKAGYRRANLAGNAFGFAQFFMFFMYFPVFLLGAYLIRDGKYTADEVMKVFFFLSMAGMGTGNNNAFAPNIAKARVAINSVFKLLDRVSLIDPFASDGGKFENVTGRIELRNVTFSYPTRADQHVFQGMNLAIEPGQRVALVGSSGSGKSTIVGLLQRFYDPNDGQVCLDGHDLRDLNLAWLRMQYGMVGQEPVLFATSIIENIRYGKPDATLEEVVAAAKQANAHDFISKLPAGYDTEIKQTQLSGGQKQRVAIARAIIRNPKILLLDEATSALDAESERLVQDALDKLMVGRTTVIVAHRLSTIKTADRIIVVHEGKVVESGTHDELMAMNRAYASLVMRQSH